MVLENFNRKYPIVVIGSGLAGLMAARIVSAFQPVLLLTKQKICDSNTRHSQGGIAAVWSKEDSPDLHIRDTLIAGKGLCDKSAVALLSRWSKPAIEKLIENGVLFDKDSRNSFRLGLEGAHSLPRILYAGGDATGAEIQRALVDSVRLHGDIEILEDAHVTEIINEEGRIQGVTYFNKRGERSLIACQQVILAAGGAGQLYEHTSNPNTATGEGSVLAYMAGAELADLEFYQFHPTGLNIPGAPNFLISEAVRGEGAVLRNSSGTPIMEKVHPLKDLAPRDIVARTIAESMQADNGSPVYLDATGIGEDALMKRFPTIYKNCLKYRIDIRKDPIPVIPVAHYMIGGVVSDLDGRSTVKGLYVSGETARTGVHGANRLASNSLLECVVFSIRCADAIRHDQSELPEHWKNRNKARSFILSDQNLSQPPSMDKQGLQKLMWKNVGLERNRDYLQYALDKLQSPSFRFGGDYSREKFELFSMKTLSRLMAMSALQREESRGSHFRSDFPKSSDSFLFPINRSLATDTIALNAL